MTLKEKLITVLYKTSNANYASELLEKVADEFAIGFAEWKDKFIDEIADWKLDGVFLKNTYTTKELLEIYKKEIK
jgi:hypothetical protein